MSETDWRFKLDPNPVNERSREHLPCCKNTTRADAQQRIGFLDVDVHGGIRRGSTTASLQALAANVKKLTTVSGLHP